MTDKSQFIINNKKGATKCRDKQTRNQLGSDRQMKLMGLDDSFFENFDRAPGEEYFKYIDERINQQIAEGLKKALKLLVDKLDAQIQNKIKGIVKQEF